MLKAKDGTVRLTLSPFVKVVLVVIAVALCLIAVRGFFTTAKPLYAQSATSMDVNIKSIGGWSVSGSLPVDIEEFPYDALKVTVEE